MLSDADVRNFSKHLLLNTLKANSHTACRAHAVPLPCRAAKGLERVFPILFTQCSRVWFTLAMPRPCHPRPCHSSQGHSTAWPSRKSPWTNCLRSVSSGYHAEFHEVAIRRIPISDAGGQCETKHRLSRTRKIVVAAHYKKDNLLHCWTSSRIFSATMSTFTKYTAPSEQGRGAAWHVWGMAGERHGRGMRTACYVWIGLYTTSCKHSLGLLRKGRNHRPKHVEMIGIINKPLLLHLVGCLY